jgi:Type I phosphodiesterase / nucleotide pyrophosphatase
MSKVISAAVGGCVVMWGLFAVSSSATPQESAVGTSSAGDAERSAGLDAPDYRAGLQVSRPKPWDSSGAATTSDSATAAAKDEAEPVAPAPVEHVVCISLDGFNPEAVSTLGPAGAPTFHRLMSEAASTLNARTATEQTLTLPNHSSMVSGREIATPGGHGVTFNQDNGSTIHASAGDYVASIFDLVHDNGGTTGLYVGKAKFGLLDRSWNSANGAPDATGRDDGRDKIDSYQLADSPTTLETLLAQLASPTPKTLSFVHFNDTDGAGHASGFMSAAYLDAVSDVDGYVDRVLETVVANRGLASRTVVIVTTDHGGVSGTFDHSDPTDAANYTVPFFVWGAGVAAGADLYALNPDRANPGTAQPPYTAPAPPIRTGEAANLIADVLGYGPVPEATFNSDHSLDLS